MTKTFLCVANRHGDGWEAICLDLDIAVSGRSFAEVQRTLGEAVGSYIEDAYKEAPEVRDALLSRRAPLFVRLRYVLGLVVHVLLNRRRDRGADVPFGLPCHA